MTTPFAAKKSSILSSLLVPSETYTDASPKGSIDTPIRSLVDSLNSIPSLVTTSSCSGRLAIYAAGSASKGSSSGGRWIFVSHSRLPAIGSLSDLLQWEGNEIPLSSSTVAVIPRRESIPFDERDRMVHMKFEPLILHVLCADLVAGRRVLQAAMGAGFRESGIASLPKPAERRTIEGKDGEGEAGRKGYPRRERKKQGDEAVMVAVRTTGLAFDAPIGIVGEGEGIEMLVGDEYIAGMVKVANARFEVNENRKKRLLEGISKAFDVQQENEGNMEAQGGRGDEGEAEDLP